ncbi:MAG: GlsB/YeaQ/YmgE family stress response membrane protein [Actinomycetota bacterium]|nr:GlsB/YeaQ/YmgE family stress response membrane protein [Actinomycetota bacterium]
MDTGSIFSALLAGIVLGALGRLIIPGKQAIGWILTFVLGLLGAFVGGFLAEGLGIDTWWQILIVQAIVAAFLVFAVAGFLRSKSSARTR